METIMFILNAIATGIGIAAKKTVEEATKDSYEKLKARLKKNFSMKPEAQMALMKYEEKPKVWEKPLKDALIEIGADKDKKLIEIAKTFMEQMNPQQATMGKFNIQIKGGVRGFVQGDKNHVTMNFAENSKEK